MSVHAKLRISAILPLLLAAAPAGAVAPVIAKVAFKKAGTTLSATITGKNFGAVPLGVPCTNCNIAEFALANGANLRTGLAYNITGWTATSITLTGIAVPAGNAVFIDVKNDALNNIATWAGTVPGKVPVPNPKVTKVAFSGKGATLQITITGTGFGAAPSGVPGTGDIPYLEYLEWAVKNRMQYNYPWAAGWNGQNFIDTVTFKYTSWTNTQIVINGFGGAYGTNGFVATKGDPFVVLLWQTPGTVPGSTGPQTGKGGRLP